MTQCAFRAVLGLPTALSLSVRPITWDALLPLACQHRVLGLLYAGLTTTTLLPAAVAQAWQPLVFGQARYTARCTAEAERLFRLLDSRATACVLVKGPALAGQAWPDKGLRSFDDLDFRCGKRDLGAVFEVMCAAGYAPETARASRRDHLWHFGWGTSFVHPEGLRVEISDRFFPPQFPWPRRLTLERSEPFIEQPLDRSVVRSPSPALHLLLSCLHAVWHGWERLGWVADIGGLLVRHPAAFEQAEALTAPSGFARRALHTGCGVAETLLGPGLVSAPLTEAPPPAVAWAVELLTRDTPGVPSAQRDQCHRQLLRGGERLRYAARRMFIPGDGDFRRVNLPRQLRGAYWILRPFRALMCARKPAS